MFRTTLYKLALCAFLIPRAALAAPLDSTNVTTPPMASGMIIPGNLTVTGIQTVGTGTGTVVFNNGSVNAASQIQAASIAAIGNIVSSSGNVAALGTVSGSGIIAGSSGVTSQGSVLSQGTVQGSSLAGALAGSYVQGAVALATNATKAAGTSVICNNGLVEGTDNSGDFACENTIANSTNAADAVSAQAAAELTGLLNASQVTGTVASAASVTGNVAGSQIQGAVANATNAGTAANLSGTITGNQVNGAVASAITAGTAGSAGSLTGTINGSQVNGAVASATNSTYSYVASNLSGNILGSQVVGPVSSATSAGGLSSGATINGSQVIGAVSNATYAGVSGASNLYQSLASAQNACLSSSGGTQCANAEYQTSSVNGTTYYYYVLPNPNNDGGVQ